MGTKTPTGSSSHAALNSHCSCPPSPHLPLLLLPPALNSHCSCPSPPIAPAPPQPFPGLLSRCLSVLPFPPVKVQMEVWDQPSAVPAADKSRSWPLQEPLGTSRDSCRTQCPAGPAPRATVAWAVPGFSHVLLCSDETLHRKI